MTPTQKQLATIKELDQKQLFQVATQSMFALNRRAKKLRDQISEMYDGYGKRNWITARKAEKETIYHLKDLFLNKVIENKHYKQVNYFNQKNETALVSFYCTYCDRYWERRCDYDEDDTPPYALDECRRCGMDVECFELEDTTTCWSLIDLGNGYSFHSPNIRLPDSAIEIEPHDPTQPNRGIPKIGITIAAQYAAIEEYLAR